MHSDKNKEQLNSLAEVSKVNSIKPKSETKNPILNDDSLFYRLYLIKYYDQPNGKDDSKNFTLFKNRIDTSFTFNFQLRRAKFSRKIQNFARGNQLQSMNNYIKNSLFYLEEIKSINDSLYLGIFVEYFGFERICYAYGLLKITGGDYTVKGMYSRLDITGIGEIKFDDIKIFSDSCFYIIGDNHGEGHQTVAIHYFPDNMNNETFLLEKCYPSAEANPHDDKLEYSVDYTQDSIKIVKSEMNYDKDKNWHLVSENKYNIVDIINSEHNTSINADTLRGR